MRPSGDDTDRASTRRICCLVVILATTLIALLRTSPEMRRRAASGLPQSRARSRREPAACAVAGPADLRAACDRLVCRLPEGALRDAVRADAVMLAGLLLRQCP